VPRFAVSNKAKNDGFLRVIEIQSTTSFGEEVKPLDPYHKILQHIKDTCGIIQASLAKLMDISFQVSPCFATRCLC
jgi:hypothetical protein